MTWYVVAAAVLTVSAILGVLIGRLLAWAGRWDTQIFSPSGPVASQPPYPEGESE